MQLTRPHDNFLIRHATTVAILTLTVLMLLSTWLFWREEQESQQAKGWVVHTYEVREHIRLLFGNLSDAEMGQRGYLASGDEEYLEPYAEALRDGARDNADTISTEQHRSIAQELAIIRKLTADNPSQQSNLDEMDDVVARLLNYLATTIRAKQNQHGKTDLTALNILHGKELMDHIRGLVRIMEAEESHLLALRIEADEISTRQNEWVTFTGIGVFYLTMMFAILLYQRSRMRAQAELLHYTHELEQREEELKMQQEELKASNEEIEASNEEMEEKTRVLEEQNLQIQNQSKALEENQRLIEEKAYEIERASKYKSEFLANMSHELRTPLNSLLILAKLLAANEGGNLTEEQIEEAHIIHNGGLELLGLINDILDLSKVEAGKFTIVAEDTPLDSIVKHMQQQFSPVAKQKNVAFHISIAVHLPAILHTDAQRVEQILKNLLSNAFKFTERGSITLNVRAPEKEEMQRASFDYENAVAFSVIDTGIGIEPSKFKDIFEAFQQEDGSIDRHYGGTGLGLTIARKFAHMLGGEIHVASIKGEGSCFTLVLPLVHEPAEVAEPAAAQSERIEIKPMPKTWTSEFIVDDRRAIGAKDKVLLIIEDDANFASTLMKIARKRGYKCLAAADGKAGLLLAVEEPVNAIILDLKLPDMDGMLVLDQLKHHLKTRHIPVHIISGRDDAENIALFRKGAIGYAAKPVEKEALDGVFTKIEDLLEAEVKHVLVVEDDKKNQVAIQNLLKQNVIHITTVGTGRDALEQMKKTQFDCIVLDLQLPDMSGFEWLEHVDKTTLPPVIVYTARELSEEENRKLSFYTGSIIIKGAKSPERLLDEVTLFLHSVESTLSSDQQHIIRMRHNPDTVLKGRTILLTDDDLRNTFALSKLLKLHGMNIVIADNGQMALEKLREDRSI